MRIRTRFALLATVLSLAAALPRGWAEPRTGWNLAARVPASTIAFASLEGIDTWEGRIEQTAIGKLFAEPEMAAFLAPIGKAIEELQAGGGGFPGMDEVPPIVHRAIEQLQHLRGQLAVAFLGMNDPHNQAGQKGPRLVASLDFGPHVGDFVTFLKNLKAEMGEEGQALEATERDGRTWWSVKAGRRGPTIHATTVDTAFVISTDGPLLDQVAKGGATGTLGTSVDFQSAMRRVGGDSTAVFFYGNVPAAVETFLAPEMSAKERRIANALGLDTVKSVAYGLAFSGDGFMDTILVHTPGADHGIVASIKPAPWNGNLLDLVPANAFYYNEGNGSPAEILAAVRKLVPMVDASAASEIEEGLQHISRMLGVDVEKEVIAGIGDTIGLYASFPETGGLYPEVALAFTVKDAPAFEGVFSRLADGIAGAVNEEGDVLASTRVIEYRGTRLHLFELQEANGDDVVPFTPTWAILGDRLVVTLVPYAMKEIVARRAEGGKGLAGQEDFAALRAQMPDGTSTFEYVDLQAAMNLVYDTGIPLLQTAVKPNVLPVPIPLDWAQLPTARTVRKHFRSMGAFYTWNQDGISISMHGPVPMLPFVFAAVAVASFTVTRAEHREMARRVAVPYAVPSAPSAPPDDMDLMLAQVQADDLARHVDLYLLEKKAFPKELQDLVAADYMDAVPVDPWGRPFRLKIVDANARTFRIVSAGKDAKFGTGDDVTSGAD